MVFRFVLRLLSNNEHLVQRLSESYPVRRAAQWVVLVFHKGKFFLEDTSLKHKITPEEFKSMLEKFTRSVKEGKDKFQK